MNSVRADAEGAARSGATSTPTFYIEGGLLEGALPIEVFRQVLDSVYGVKSGKDGKDWKVSRQGDKAVRREPLSAFLLILIRSRPSRPLPSFPSLNPRPYNARKTSYNACVHAVIPNPRST